ncbi:hypothetical protein OROGR_018246 [Orobanche gracilis]
MKRKSKMGKSNKLEKIRKKSQTVENELSLNNLLESRGEDPQDEIDRMSSGDEDYSKGMNKSKPEDPIANFEGLEKMNMKRKSKTGRSKKHERIKKKSLAVGNELSLGNILKTRGEDAQDEINQVSSGDEDCSKGMKNCKPEDLANFEGLEKANMKRKSKTGKSKKHEKIKKKSRTVENELSPDNLLESRGEDVHDESFQMSGNEDYSKEMKKSKREDIVANFEGLEKASMKRKSKTGKSKRCGKIHKSRPVESTLSLDNLLESRGEDAQDEIYQMSSGDEDYSKGMKKWITQYRQSRPGLKLLQERIDDFIMAHEAQEEKARVEREAQAAEGGWTVVAHHKGRKKTTEPETGVVVGSVAQAAVMDKMAKKKTKEVGIDFYRFQKREAHKNDHDAAKQIRTG